MLTTRMSPKISEKPLATMKSRPAKVSASRRIGEERAGIVDRRAERRRPPVAAADLRRRVGDDEDVEDREDDQTARDDAWHASRPTSP